MTKQLITIGESIHASISKTGKVLSQLNELGSDAFSRPREPLNYLKDLIESQARGGADYIAVNLDAFGEDRPSLAVELMKEYVRLVQKYGKGVPVCIDSSDDNVLIAGLEQWYASDRLATAPLVNSVKLHTMDRILPHKKHYDFSFIALLITEQRPTGPGGSHSVDELYSVARKIFESAVNEYGFQPQEIFFDTTVFPLAIDIPMMPGVPGYTYRTFQTIKRIKNDPKMKDVHFSLGISNCCRDLPGRKIAVCRAYVQKAMEYGLDAGIVNVFHRFGEKPADPEIVELLDAYAQMDGSAESTNKAMTLMSRFCEETKKLRYK